MKEIELDSQIEWKMGALSVKGGIGEGCVPRHLQICTKKDVQGTQISAGLANLREDF